jgi:hypothetical protein
MPRSSRLSAKVQRITRRSPGQIFLFVNLFPVTIGNIIGGVGLVGLVYWFIYLRVDATPTVSEKCESFSDSHSVQPEEASPQLHK